MKFFVAGPVSVSDNMKHLNYEPIGHREKEFCDIFKRVTSKLLKVFKANSDYSVVIVNGSGTAAIESVLSSVVGDKKLLILNNGAFGDRLEQISNVYGLGIEVSRFAWNEPIAVDMIKDKLARGDIDFVAAVHHETSTGALNPIHEIGKLCKGYNAAYIVDAMSSFGGEQLSVVDDHIDLAISSTNKCLCGLPVLSFVCIKNSTLEKYRGTKPKSFYLDLFKHYDYAKKGQTPYTPQIPLFYMLDKALDELFAEGVDNRIKRYASNARLLRSILKSAGLKFYLREEQTGSIVTNVLIPKGLSYQELHDELKKKGYIIYPGKGELEGKVVNLSHIGTLNAIDIEEFCSDFIEVIQSAK